MKTLILAGLLGALLHGPALHAKAAVGEAAPDFSAADASGKPVKLADFSGKYLVIEWVNPECPFVKKHYDSGNLPATQKKALSQGAAWVTVQTSAAGNAATTLASWQADKKSAPTATVIDSSGSLGRSFGARTTPHMYVIDPEGKLIYAGAIDSKPSADQEDIATSTNYVDQALAEAMAGKPVSEPVTQAYGCAVKYPAGA